MDNLTKNSIASLQRLTEQEVSRKEFIAYAGALFLGIIGVSNLLRAVNETNRTVIKSAARGYGSGTYGEAKKLR